MTKRLDLAYRHAADLGLLVVEEDLGRRFGEYLDDAQVIVVNSRLTTAQRTSCLAHEVAHAVFGDRRSAPELERRADQYGAALIISAEEYRAAEESVGEHEGALASELGVTPRLIRAWREWWRRRGHLSHVS